MSNKPLTKTQIFQGPNPGHSSLIVQDNLITNGFFAMLPAHPRFAATLAKLGGAPAEGKCHRYLGSASKFRFDADWQFTVNTAIDVEASITNKVGPDGAPMECGLVEKFEGKQTGYRFKDSRRAVAVLNLALVDVMLVPGAEIRTPLSTLNPAGVFLDGELIGVVMPMRKG